MRHHIRFDRLGSVVMTPLGAGPAHSYVDVTDDAVRVRLGWTFSATIPRASITDVQQKAGSVISRGAHGWRGRWLVNGAGDGLVVVTIDPPVPAKVAGFPVHLRELIVSADDPDELVTALSTGD